jgi:hypothetical protein
MCVCTLHKGGNKDDDDDDDNYNNNNNNNNNNLAKHFLEPLIFQLTFKKVPEKAFPTQNINPFNFIILGLLNKR